MTKATVTVTTPRIVLSEVHWSMTLSEALDLRDLLNEGINTYVATFGDDTREEA